MERTLGFYYECDSVLDKAPIVVTFTGFKYRSENIKTGDMIQTWIMRRDINPFTAAQTGEDESVCGQCPFRRFLGGNCYVLVADAPLQSYKKYKEGKYTRLDFSNLGEFHDRLLRIGAYGDPAAVPATVWQTLVEKGKVKGWTGYTHQWRREDAAPLKKLIMASTETAEDSLKAQQDGWLTFRVRQAGEPAFKNERVCPASIEAGHKATCAQCMACNGRRGNRVIVEH